MFTKNSIYQIKTREQKWQISWSCIKDGPTNPEKLKIELFAVVIINLKLSTFVSKESVFRINKQDSNIYQHFLELLTLLSKYIYIYLFIYIYIYILYIYIYIYNLQATPSSSVLSILSNVLGLSLSITIF